MRSSLESAAKKLQIMESSIKLHRSWVLRSGCQEKALAEFDREWRILMQFSSSEPCQEFRCAFLWDLRLQILADQACKPTAELVTELFATKLWGRLAPRPGGVENAAVAEVQFRHLRQYVAAALCCQKTEVANRDILGWPFKFSPSGCRWNEIWVGLFAWARASACNLCPAVGPRSPSLGVPFICTPSWP